MFRTILVFLLIISCSWVNVALGDSKGSSSPKGYHPEVVYDGLYKADRLYQYNPHVEAWYASKTLKTVASLSCTAAKLALSNQGEWVGVFSESGGCAGTAEGQRWVTGNFLNYLIAKTATERSQDN